MYMEEMSLKALKQSRENAGLTQKEVEETLQLRRLTIRDYEMGRLKLPVSVAMKMCDLYQVSLDELVARNSPPHPSSGSKTLSDFASLFVGNGFGVMFLDPILRAFLEDHQHKYFESSLFDLLTEGRSQKQKQTTVLEINRFLFSLASVDGKMCSSEIECIKYLMSSFGIQNQISKMATYAKTPYYPAPVPDELKPLEMRHFIIWLLFFFGHADGHLDESEVEYITHVAETLKVNRSNYLFIQAKFVKEEEI